MIHIVACERYDMGVKYAQDYSLPGPKVKNVNPDGSVTRSIITTDSNPLRGMSGDDCTVHVVGNISESLREHLGVLKGAKYIGFKARQIGKSTSSGVNVNINFIVEAKQD